MVLLHGLHLQRLHNMNKEQIQDRIKKLENEREQLKATLLAYEGAIQDCNYWLQELDKPSEEKKEKPLKQDK